MSSQSNQIELSRKYSHRYPIDILARAELNQGAANTVAAATTTTTAALANNYRIKSAQNVSKQRTSGRR
jgi:hypothetical protein